MKNPASKLTAYFYVRERVLPNINCTAQDAAVLLMLAGYANPDGTKIYQSFGSLAKSTKLSPRSVVRSIAYWIQTGLLVRVRQGGGRGSANEYRIVLLEKAALDDLIARVNCVSRSQFGRPKLCPSRPETVSPATGNCVPGDINCAPAWHTTVKSLPKPLTENHHHGKTGKTDDDDDGARSHSQHVVPESAGARQRRLKDSAFPKIKSEFGGLYPDDQIHARLDEIEAQAKGPPVSENFYVTAFRNNEQKGGNSNGKRKRFGTSGMDVEEQHEIIRDTARAIQRRRGG